MFGWLKKKSEKDKLIDLHKKLIEEAYKLSTINRKDSDLKTAEAEEVWKQIEAINNSENTQKKN